MKIETILYTRRQKKGFFALSGSLTDEPGTSDAVTGHAVWRTKPGGTPERPPEFGYLIVIIE
jgi:hypothetical protein